MTVRTMKSPLRLLFALSLLVFTSGALQAAEDVRFSKTLSADESAALGVAQLSSDQLAVLDALVRRDIDRADYVAKQSRAQRFSQRLSENERRNAGLDTLAEAQLAELDRTVERLMPPPRTGQTFVASGSKAGPYSVPSVKLRREPEIHGAVTLMVGVGSHGYSEYGGAAEFTYYDPTNKFALTVGYAETHAKGGHSGRVCYDPFWRPGLLW
jgi:hypothetical protein